MKPQTRKTAEKTVDAYIEALPDRMKRALTNVRAAVRSVLPDSEQVISYQIPTFKLHGKGVIAIAAFKNHCSLFTMSYMMVNAFKKELADYNVKGTTIHFSPDEPLPRSLVKKIVAARVKEIAAVTADKTGKSKPKATEGGKKLPMTKRAPHQTVGEYMAKLKHPMKPEMEAVRAIIRGANRNIGERIKWNAPSYYYQPGDLTGKVEDLVTFNGWATRNVHLVFHHPNVVNIESPILQGSYASRRMVYFNTIDEINASKKELQRVIRKLVDSIKNEMSTKKK